MGIVVRFEWDSLRDDGISALGHWDLVKFLQAFLCRIQRHPRLRYTIISTLARSAIEM
jgi:hypothetical protein